MCIRIDSNDINLLIYHYLQERGLHHTAFGFFSEAAVTPNPIKPGALVSYLHKSLQMEELQHHINDKVYLSQGIPECTNNFSLLKPHECRYVETPSTLQREDFIELTGHSDIINSIHYMAQIYSCSNDGNIMIWSDVGCQSILPHLTPMNQSAPVLHFAIANDGKIASFAADDMVRIWEHGELSSTWYLQGIVDLAWSPDGNKLMAISQETLRFWTDYNWEVQSDLTDIISAQWKSNFEFSVITGKAVWLCRFGESRQILEDSCSSAKWNKSCTVLGMICSNRLGLYTESSEVWWIPVRVTQFDFSPNDEIIVTGGFAGEIQFWDLERRVIRNSFQGHSGKILRIMFRGDGEFVATTGVDGILHIWKVEEFMKVKSFVVEPVSDMKWSPVGNRLAVAKQDKIIILEVS